MSSPSRPSIDVDVEQRRVPRDRRGHINEHTRARPVTSEPRGGGISHPLNDKREHGNHIDDGV
jgi:hypothetical protein